MPERRDLDFLGDILEAIRSLRTTGIAFAN